MLEPGELKSGKARGASEEQPQFSLAGLDPRPAAAAKAAAAPLPEAARRDGKRALKTGMIAKKPQQLEQSKGVRDDIEGEDDEESYYR